MNIKNIYRRPCIIKFVERRLENIFLMLRISEPSSSANIIISNSLGILYSSLNSKKLRINNKSKRKIEEFSLKRIQGFPLQYIVGEWDFYGRIFKLKSPIFIPRPETEELINLALKRMINVKSFVEIGCGSGVISVTLLSLFPNTTATCIDINADACQLTKENAIKHNIINRLEILNLSHHDFINNFNREKYDLLISNPPYIPSNEIPDLQTEVKDFEDHLALDGGQDGLACIKNILSNAPVIIKNKGIILLETGHEHPITIKEFIDNKILTNLKFIQHNFDFNNKMRFCHLEVI